MADTRIEWTAIHHPDGSATKGKTWNPTTGCVKISPGCKYCYAERMAKRLKAMGQEKYCNGFKLTLHNDALEIPLIWKKPQIIFVNSMSDLFHEDIPVEFIQKIFDVMHRASWHTFQVLTKRSERLAMLASKLRWPSNIWMGVTVEIKNYIYRTDHLRQTDAYIKFLSLEPLLGPLPDLDLQGIDWMIVGGESGPRARQMKEEWVVNILAQCRSAGVPFFFKQWGGVNKKRTGRLLQGRIWNNMPSAGKHKPVYLLKSPSEL